MICGIVTFARAATAATATAHCSAAWLPGAARSQAEACRSALDRPGRGTCRASGRAGLCEECGAAPRVKFGMDGPRQRITFITVVVVVAVVVAPSPGLQACAAPRCLEPLC
eukprot:13314228-Alexandrium_andersonii.AAC.1